MGPGATSRHTRRLLALALAPLACALGVLVALAATLPATALARSPRTGNGGGGIGVTGGAGAPVSPTGSSTGAGSSRADVVKLSGVVNTRGDGITLTVAASGIAHHPLTLTGSAPSSDAGGTVEIEARPKHAKWTRVATGVIGSGGAFSAAWAPAASAQVAIRAVLAPGLGDPLVRSQTASGSGLPGGASPATTPTVFTTSAVMIPIFRSAIATIYGPGLWGHRTACGQRLQKTTLGVASRTLKCGTNVAVDFRGRELTVPVIDRGPFGGRASWDLTLATADALGVKETSTVGTLAPAPASLVAAPA
ncbi:MAG TPA: septal ring lytic transglycosylase RlpA family protein [Solirubrobacteraceae bacterium]|nr:septal ring lytic transglycosylase RlpA family protein [Solirubrobacteraceae bacterium]